MVRSAEQSIVTALGLTGSIKVGVVGDSRMQGTGATIVGTNDARAIMQSGSLGFTRVAVGPIDDGSASASKQHFARSAYVTRTIPRGTLQVGHSQRSPHTLSIDSYVGPGKSFNDTKIWVDCIGVNESALNQWNYVDEWVRMCEYRITQQVALTGVLPTFVLVNEPTTGATTTGPQQYMLRARNRAYHAAVTYLRTLTTVAMVNANLESYFP
jgi:hypothetical protein